VEGKRAASGLPNPLAPQKGRERNAKGREKKKGRSLVTKKKGWGRISLGPRQGAPDFVSARRRKKVPTSSWRENRSGPFNYHRA